MRLSETEKMMVAKLRKRKESLVRRRPSALLSSACTSIAGAFLIFLNYQALSDLSPDSKHFGDHIFLYILTMLVGFYFIIYGVWLFTDTLVNWHGRPEVDLLLRLIEESRDKAERGA